MGHQFDAGLDGSDVEPLIREAMPDALLCAAPGGDTGEEELAATFAALDLEHERLEREQGMQPAGVSARPGWLADEEELEGVDLAQSWGLEPAAGPEPSL